MKNIVAAVALAIALQPLLFLAAMALPLLFAGEPVPLLDMAQVSLFTSLVALPFVLLLGIPLALFLKRQGQFRWKWLALAGFAAAALPVALLGPGAGPGFSSGGNFHGRLVDFVVDGKPTIWGWLQWAQSTTYFGLHGVLAASAFWFVLRHSMAPNNSSKPTPLRGAA